MNHQKIFKKKKERLIISASKINTIWKQKKQELEKFIRSLRSQILIRPRLVFFGWLIFYTDT